jgi:thymidylate synthase ThyX
MKKEQKKTLHEIIIIDDFPPEDIAMLQALYSRDPRSVKTHLEKVRESGPGKFMEKFYVGYGHKSIGDCGTTTLFAEGVSMLCAKAIQDWLLYNGQESSTRYLDFSKMAILNPVGIKSAEKIQTRTMKLYNEALNVLTKDLKNKYPIKAEEKPEIYDKAIRARAFDISRCLLPAGMTTMVAWHTNLRQAADHLKSMRHHPLEEVRMVAQDMIIALQTKYPNSFGHKQYPEEEKYLEISQKNVAYLKPFAIGKELEYKSYLKKEIIERYKNELKNRPPKAELPYQLRAAGDIVFKFLLDFGSYRDLQRQRSMIAPQPLLTTKFGFHPWYLEQFPADFRKKVKSEFKDLVKEIKALKISDEVKQYYIPMGFQVAIEMTATIPSAVYIAELRSGKTVHQTLRPVAQKIGGVLKKLVPNIAIHCDFDKDEFSIKRGSQDIIEKK